MKTIILDGKRLTSINAIYDFLKKELNLPDYFGRNLDALYECIVDEDIELSVKIEILHPDIFKKTLGKEYYDNLLSVFTDSQEELGNDIFQFEVK